MLVDNDLFITKLK